MNKLEIINEINNLNYRINNLYQEINQLFDDEQKYRKMKVKLVDAANDLSSAKKNVNKAYTSLKKNYSSTIADKKLKTLQTQYNSINTAIKKIDGVLLAAAVSKIQTIDNNRTNKEREVDNAKARISYLRTELKKLEMI